MIVWVTFLHIHQADLKFGLSENVVVFMCVSCWPQCFVGFVLKVPKCLIAYSTCCDRTGGMVQVHPNNTIRSWPVNIFIIRILINHKINSPGCLGCWMAGHPHTHVCVCVHIYMLCCHLCCLSWWTALKFSSSSATWNNINCWAIWQGHQFSYMLSLSSQELLYYFCFLRAFCLYSGLL